jgi:hypothetical protein
MTDGKIVQSEERTITLCRPNVVNGKDIFKNHMSDVENDQNAYKGRLRPYAGCSGTHLRKISRHFFIGMQTGSFADYSPCKNREGDCVFTPAAFSGYITDLIKKETGSDYFNSIIFFTLVKLPAERR